MARISNNYKRENKDYGDSSQLTNWILDSGATCHMTPEVTDFIPGSLEDTYKFIEVADGHHVTAKQKGSVRIQMFDDNGNTFIATLYNVLLAPDLYDRLFSIITLMNAGYTCRAYVPITFQKGFNKRCEHERLCLLFFERTGTRLVRQTIFHHYINECWTYVYFPQGFLQGLLRRKRV